MGGDIGGDGGVKKAGVRGPGKSPTKELVVDCPLLNHLYKALEPQIGLAAIEDPMVNRQRYVCLGSDLQGVQSIDRYNTHSFFKRPDAKDRRLWLIDDNG